MSFLASLRKRRRWLLTAVVGLWPWFQPKLIWLIDNVFGNWLLDSVSISIRWPNWAASALAWSSAHPVGSIVSAAAVVVAGMAIASYVDEQGRQHLAPSRLPNGPMKWQLIQKIVHIPDARLAKEPRLWAEGLGYWDSFAIHNLWANRPATQEEFVLWRDAVHKWGDEVVVWMKTAGIEFLDWRHFAELGDVVGGPLHPDPMFSHELVMLKMKRARLNDLIERFRSRVQMAPPVQSIEQTHKLNGDVDDKSPSQSGAEASAPSGGPRLILRDPGAVHIVNDVDFRDATGKRVWRVDSLRMRFVNKPKEHVQAAVAHNIGARISFSRDGVVIREVDARWTDSEQPINRLANHQSIIDLLRVDFDIREEREIDIALKAPEERVAYIFNNDSYLYEGRKPDFALEPGTYGVRVQLAGVGVDEVFKFSFTNPGEGGRIQIVEPGKRVLIMR